MSFPLATIIPPQLFTYLLRNDFNVLLILFQSEHGSRAWAVCVAFGSIFIIPHNRCLSEGTEVERVNNPSFVGLTADEFTEGCPNLGHLAHLVPLNSFFFRRFSARARASRYSCVELFEEFCDGASSYKCLQYIALVLCHCCHLLSLSSAKFW